jgi:ferrous iron transport protein B
MQSARRIILIGAPNSGKTTFFNHLTHLKYKTVNYPGSTVESAIGKLQYSQKNQYPIQVIDTPGIMSLSPKSEDEQVTINILTNAKESAFILVLNSVHLTRQLALFKQLSYMKITPTVVLSLKDIADQEGISIDTAALSTILGTPIYAIDATSASQVNEVAEKLTKVKYHQVMPITALSDDQIIESIQWAQSIADSVTSQKVQAKKYDIDKILLNSITGPIIFCTTLFIGFWSIFSLATPIMDKIDTMVALLQNGVTSYFPPSLISTIIAKGIIPSIGGVIIFVPQIALLFFLVGLLENSGYLARGAALLDRPLSKIGLNGRSFAPLLSGFVCAIPAILSARTITNKKERLITQLIVPLMSCSARLPVYGLLLTLLALRISPVIASVGMICIYVTSILISTIIAKIMDRFIPNTETTGFYIELPKLQTPNIKGILVQSAHQTLQFVKKAGPIIFIVGISLWVLSEYPSPTHSYIEMIGKWLNPVWLPMGVDWRIGVGLLLSFAAREVFVSAIAVIFAVESGSSSMTSMLQLATLPNGQPLLSAASIAGLIVFFMISMQCMSTLAVLKQETNTWKWPLIVTIAYTLLGYGAAVLTYQLMA